MGEKIYVGPVNKGLSQYYTAFNIDNDSFPILQNAYQWRGRVKRKRGLSLLGRLEKYFNSTSLSYSSTATINLVGGIANLLTGFSLQANGNIVPGSVTITDVITGFVYTDLSKNGVLTGTPAGSGTINYATEEINISGGGADDISAIFIYYPDLPVMGLEALFLPGSDFQETLAFDTTYSYYCTQTAPYPIYNVSFYKNPSSQMFNGIMYTAKTNPTPLSWNGQDYQQFYTTSYEGALWATNGITIPFMTTNIGMQFMVPATVMRNSLTEMTFTITETANSVPLVIGDWVFVNEFVSTTPANANTLNYQTGFVTSASTVAGTTTIVVRFPNAKIANDTYSMGIIQYLTSRANVQLDCLRWFDGDPTNGNSTNPSLNTGLGWVNFSPPLTSLTNPTFRIDDLPLATTPYYLVGARIVIPFKDRLLFMGPVVQTSTLGPYYLQDVIVYSQNGTPYYTCSFDGSVTDALFSAATDFFELLVPENQAATANAYIEDVIGFGGDVEAAIASPIISAAANEDVLIIGFNNRQGRLIATGDGVNPFLLFIINSEYGTGSTFSAITLDRGVLTTGQRGIIVTEQVSTSRLDIQIPDQIFQFNLMNNGLERVTAQRDFINEWIYFSYPSNEENQTNVYFPNQTLLYNYRDDSWAIFIENFTTYGQFIQIDGDTWLTIGNKYPTWNDWNVPWNAGASTARQPMVVAGNQQGFVFLRETDTAEPPSLYITSFSGVTVTSLNHSLNDGDFIIISGCYGTVGAQVNGQIFSVSVVDEDNFNITCFYQNIVPSGTYFGNGVITRMYIPFIQTKQFPMAWNMAKKTRIGPQQYLLTKTDNAQIELQIYLSMNAASPYNFGPIVPDIESENNSLIYSDVLYTCPESTNLGLTPANTNLQMVTASQQQQIWHRMNTSLIGDTVQIGFTLSPAQMRSFMLTDNVVTITGASQAYPCVLTSVNNLAAGQMILIQGIIGMTELNNLYFNIISANSTTITINVDSTSFLAYVSGGTATLADTINQFAEIELHAFTIDVQPSQVIA